MSKNKIIEQIQERNPTAGDEFLMRFDSSQLWSYLTRLERLHGRRGRDTCWVREPAIARPVKPAA